MMGGGEPAAALLVIHAAAAVASPGHLRHDCHPDGPQMRRGPQTVALIRCVLLLVAVLLLPACTALYDDRCGDESRDVYANTRMPNAQGDSTGYAQVGLGGHRVREPRQSVSWYVMRTDLWGHIQAARIVASEDTGSVLLSLPLTAGPEDIGIALQGDIAPYVGTLSFDQLFLRARAGGLTLVLASDIPDRGVIVLPLQLFSFSDWGRPHCS
jgi:hypothetical protein